MRHLFALFLGFLVLAGPSGAASADEPRDVKRPPRTGEAAAPEPTAVPASSPFFVEAEVGYGYDHNVYEAPRTPYVDYFPATPVLTIPVVHSGPFIPVFFKTGYTGDPGTAVRLLASYRFTGDYFLDTELNNADQYTHKAEAGVEFVLNRKGKREDTLSLIPFVKDHHETYYDHDSGLNKTTSAGVDISNRYTYRSTGATASFALRSTAVQAKLKAEIEKKDYEDPVVVSEYDHTYSLYGGELEFPVIKPTKLFLSYEHSKEDYTDRHARNAQGVYSSVNNPLLQYTYDDIGASLRNRLAKFLVVYLDYDAIDRTDHFVGYNDYAEDRYRIRALLDDERGDKLRIELVSWKRDYPHAFAFDRFGQPQKTYDGREAKVTGDVVLTKSWGFWVEYKYWDQNTTDLRYDYTEYQMMAGVKFAMM